MQELQQGDFLKYLIGVIVFLTGIINFYTRNLLSNLKSNDREIFKRLNELEKKFAKLEGEHSVHHGGGKQ